MLLACPGMAGASSAGGTFRVNLTITSQCGAWHQWFGPQATNRVIVSCQPGTTPYRAEVVGAEAPDPASGGTAPGGAHDRRDTTFRTALIELSGAAEAGLQTADVDRSDTHIVYITF